MVYYGTNLIYYETNLECYGTNSVSYGPIQSRTCIPLIHTHLLCMAHIASLSGVLCDIQQGIDKGSDMGQKLFINPIHGIGIKYHTWGSTATK